MKLEGLVRMAVLYKPPYTAGGGGGLRVVLSLTRNRAYKKSPAPHRLTSIRTFRTLPQHVHLLAHGLGLLGSRPRATRGCRQRDARIFNRLWLR